MRILKSLFCFILLTVLIAVDIIGIVEADAAAANAGGYNEKTALELGKDPGFNLRTLHKKGITGKGVGIAIFDTNFYREHSEYKDKIEKYTKIGAFEADKMTIHGTAVASLAAGKSVGVAPGAKLYLYDVNFNVDNIRVCSDLYMAAQDVVSINKKLSKENRIRVFSFSGTMDPRYEKDYSSYVKAVELLKSEGIFFVSMDTEKFYGFYYGGLERNPESNPNKLSSYKPIDWDRHSFIDYAYKGRKIYPKGDILFAPYDSRSTASQNGPKEYTFHKTGCPSWEVPYIAGLYAVACQANPDVTPELFWEKALETGYKVNYKTDRGDYIGKIINPASLMAKIKIK